MRLKAHFYQFSQQFFLLSERIYIKIHKLRNISKNAIYNRRKSDRFLNDIRSFFVI